MKSPIHPQAPKGPKKASTWWAVLAVLLLVGVAMWYESQYQAISKPLHFRPIRKAHKTESQPDSMPPPSSPSKPDESGLLIG